MINTSSKKNLTAHDSIEMVESGSVPKMKHFGH